LPWLSEPGQIKLFSKAWTYLGSLGRVIASTVRAKESKPLTHTSLALGVRARTTAAFSKPGHTLAP